MSSGNVEVTKIHFGFYCLHFCALDNRNSQSPQVIKTLCAMAFNNLPAIINFRNGFNLVWN